MCRWAASQSIWNDSSGFILARSYEVKNLMEADVALSGATPKYDRIETL